MMKYLNITGMLLLILVMSACVRDGADPCPVGTVKLNLFVEKFRNVNEDPGMNEAEDNFYNRVSHLQYYLYKDGQFVQKISVPLTGTNKVHTVTLKDLPYGDYDVALVANSTKDELMGDHTRCHNLVLRYPGSTKTEDYFTKLRSFTVDSETEKTIDVGLLRTHGIIRYKFVNMPTFIKKFNVSMDNVFYEKRIMADYENRWDMARDFEKDIITNDDAFYVGTFPTRSGEKSDAYVSLYQEGSNDPYYTKHVGNDLVVKRNDLIEITATYNNGEIEIKVDLDTEWDGSVPGGDTDID